MFSLVNQYMLAALTALEEDIINSAYTLWTDPADSKATIAVTEVKLVPSSKPRSGCIS